MNVKPPDAPNAPLRSFLKLSWVEGVLAAVFAGGVWLTLFLWMYPTSDGVWRVALDRVPFGGTFALCVAVGASAVCALRFARGDKTRAVSRFGYFASAFPALQLLLFEIYLLTLNNHFTTGLFVLYMALPASALLQFIACSVAFIRAFGYENCRGDIAVIPLYFAWHLLIAYCFFGNYEGLFEAPSP